MPVSTQNLCSNFVTGHRTRSRKTLIRLVQLFEHLAISVDLFARFLINGQVITRGDVSPGISGFAKIETVLIERIHVLAVKFSLMREIEVWPNVGEIKFDMISLCRLEDPVKITIALRLDELRDCPTHNAECFSLCLFPLRINPRISNDVGLALFGAWQNTLLSCRRAKR